MNTTERALNKIPPPLEQSFLDQILD